MSSVLDPEEVLARFYERDSEAWNILVTHSQCVADLVVRIAQQHPEISLDLEFARQAAMLHDVGICRTDAPSIHCHGSEPYIRHGILGRQMLEEIGLPRHALVCERHTGSGISKAYIDENNLQLPSRDMLPISIEEKIVCYADKFFSKSGNVREQKSFERAVKSVSRFGDESRQRFMELDRLFHIPSLC